MPFSDQAKFDQTLEKLTIRRREVLLKMLAGVTDQDIASALGISTAAVRKHIERICDFFKAELPEFAAGEVKRSDLLRLVAAYRPDMVISTNLSLSTPLDSQVYSPDSSNQSTPSSTVANEAKPDALLHSLALDQDINTLNNAQLLPKGDIQAQASELVRLGYEEYMKGNFEVAERYLKAAITLDPNRASAYYILGSAYEKMGNRSLAKQYYQQTLPLGSRAADAAANNLARLDILEGHPDLALDKLLGRIDLVSDDMVKTAIYKNLGWAYLLLGRYEEADRCLHQSLEIDPHYTAAYCLLAQVCEATGQVQAALPLWKDCLHCPVDRKQAWNWPEIELWQTQAFQVLQRQAHHNL
jgi:tetratricopeptide (TPR) repeat protein